VRVEAMVVAAMVEQTVVVLRGVTRVEVLRVAARVAAAGEATAVVLKGVVMVDVVRAAVRVAVAWGARVVRAASSSQKRHHLLQCC